MFVHGVRRLQDSGAGRPDLDPVVAASVVLAAVHGGAALFQSTGEFVHLERALDGVLAYVGVASASQHR